MTCDYVDEGYQPNPTRNHFANGNWKRIPVQLETRCKTIMLNRGEWRAYQRFLDQYDFGNVMKSADYEKLPPKVKIIISDWILHKAKQSL